MTVVHRLSCDFHGCESFIGDRGRTAVELRRFAKARGWVKARTNNRDADYCPAHSSYPTPRTPR